MPKKKLAQPRIFFGILEFHLSLEFTLAFNQFEKMLYVYQHLILASAITSCSFWAAFNSLPTTISMVTKQAVPPMKLDMGSARKTPFTEGDIQRGRSMVRGATITTFLRMEKKMAYLAFPRA